MGKLKGLYPEKVFEYFEQLSAVPHGSGNTAPIADFILNFAKAHSLRCYRDGADNVIIYKEATKGYESCEPVILQGHLDMVCQKIADSDFDFLKDGIRLIKEGDYIKAEGTTLGADNGIAVAMCMAILDDDTLSHPAIEAVFTSNEEIGMLGAIALDADKLSAKRMINIDSEEDDSVTVSCAGGVELALTASPKTKPSFGSVVKICLSGLQGGHSGVEIDKGRVNADILLGRILNHLKKLCDFEIIELQGGDKTNAIPLNASASLLTDTPDLLKAKAEEYLETVKTEILSREPFFAPTADITDEGEHNVLTPDLAENIIFALNLAPNGIAEMSREIEGLVETSSNLGILKVNADCVKLIFSFRSNKQSAMEALVQRVALLAERLGFKAESYGFYPSWEYKENSRLRELYCEIYKDQNGFLPKVEAIHAGLECAVFSSKLEDLDCIAVGPTMYDVHTTKERLYIPSISKIYNILTELLVRLK